MLKSIEVLEEGYNYKIKAFKKGRVFTFVEGINLIVGENGSGKSMLLKSILGNGKVHGGQVAKMVGSGSYKFFDTEKDNPRTKDPNLMADSMYGFAIGSRLMMSHGETMKPILTGFEKDKAFENNTLVMIDEPEMALSFKTQLVVAKSWANAVQKKNLQFVVATHSPVFMTMKSKDVKVNIISLDDTYDEMLKWLKKVGK